VYVVSVRALSVKGGDSPEGSMGLGFGGVCVEKRGNVGRERCDGGHWSAEDEWVRRGEEVMEGRKEDEEGRVLYNLVRREPRSPIRVAPALKILQGCARPRSWIGVDASDELMELASI
jgi:hypothetical protein